MPRFRFRPAGGIPARLYRKPDAAAQAGLVYLHGGSFYLGGLDSHDSITAGLTLAAHDRGGPGLKVQLLSYPALDRHDANGGVSVS